MDKEKKLLSDIIVYGKYARYIRDENRRETWKEIVERNKTMHIKSYPEMEELIHEVWNRSVLTKKVLPSMRSLQFAGEPIERNPSRIYNCAYLPIEDSDAFSETMFLLLGGCGVGYSVQRRHINKLPRVSRHLDRTRRYIIADSIEGWADSIKVLVESYYRSKEKVVFDFTDIRPKGAELVVSGGKAPGPDPLKLCLTNIDNILSKSVGRKLKPIEAHDILCYIADAVLAGGVRRAAMISLFSIDDMEMLKAKSNEWWVDNPQRGRANNSVILLRGETSKNTFNELWKIVKDSGAGEPGFYWTNNLDWGTNPCCEIALRPYQFCNLTEINASTIENQFDFNQRSRDAAFIGTLQAGYTKFHYLRPIWKYTTEQDALIGVGITGIASNKIEKLDKAEAAKIVNTTNIITAAMIGVNGAARTTTIKPAGTSSIVVGSSSGIHAWFNDYYIRRIRFNKNEAVYQYLLNEFPNLCEDEIGNKKLGGIFKLPQKAPDSAILRTETEIELLNRVSEYNSSWIDGGYLRGDNKNNVSCTISIKSFGWLGVGQWMWKHRNNYNGISVIPYDGGTYIQTPFEDIDKDEYNRLMKCVHDIDLSNVKEFSDNTSHSAEPACAGDVCEVVTL